MNFIGSNKTYNIVNHSLRVVYEFIEQPSYTYTRWRKSPNGQQQNVIFTWMNKYTAYPH